MRIQADNHIVTPGLSERIGGWLARMQGKTQRPAPPTPSGAERRQAAREAVREEGVQLEWRTADGRWVTEPVESCDASESGLGLLAENCFEPGQTIYVVRDGQRAMQANVCHVEPAGDSFRVGLALVPRERRRVHRASASGEAVARWTGQDGKTMRLPAKVRNVSDGGLQIEIHNNLDDGAVLRLTGSEVECLASVRYCRPRGDAFVAGLQIIGQPFLTPEEDSTT